VGQIVVSEFVSLDGVIEDPAGSTKSAWRSGHASRSFQNVVMPPLRSGFWPWSRSPC
jgi:hypothetical protein